MGLLLVEVVVSNQWLIYRSLPVVELVKENCAHGQRDRLTGLFLQSPQLDFQNQAVVSLEQ